MPVSSQTMKAQLRSVAAAALSLPWTSLKALNSLLLLHEFCQQSGNINHYIKELVLVRVF